MSEYHKIQSIFKRDRETNQFIVGNWTNPELEYLCDKEWIWDEKIDGTNIRIHWDGSRRTFGGRTDNAQIPAFLIQRLEELFPPERLAQAFEPGESTEQNIILYGEGFGRKIQRGSAYLPDRVDFVLFDVRVGRWWLMREDVEKIAAGLGLPVAPVIGHGTLQEAIELVSKGFQSKFGTAQAEGVVCRPRIPLFARSGERIITKIKTRDFIEHAR